MFCRSAGGCPVDVFAHDLNLLCLCKLFADTPLPLNALFCLSVAGITTIKHCSFHESLLNCTALQKMQGGFFIYCTIHSHEKQEKIPPEQVHQPLRWDFLFFI